MFRTVGGIVILILAFKGAHTFTQEYCDLCRRANLASNNGR